MADFETALVRMVRDGADLTPRQMALLMLVRREPASPGAIAETLNLKPPVVSRNLAILQNLHFLRVKESPADRRRSTATVAPAGEKFCVKYFD